MRSKLQQAGLIFLGLVAGILISVNYSAVAEKPSPAPLPVDELRTFADVFGAIKQDYVEPIDDKPLITSAISGMLTPTPSRICRSAPRANSAASASRSAWKTASSR
jgi:carboxyl-terminal processing protease